MKLTCELCGGALQMNLGGQGATCTTCGLAYPMERLREMLTGKTPVVQDPPKPEPPKPVPPKPEPEEEMIYDVTEWEKVEKFTFVPEQFTMSVTETGADYISGHIQQGGIGVGDRIYINHDYAHPYKICCLNDPSLPDAKKGMWAQLYLKKCPKRILKNASVVTGDPNPVANAYNYPGTVYEYFSNLLLGEFSQYEIHSDVPHKELEIPVSFMFYQGGKPVLAVFLSHSRDARGGRQIAKAFRTLALEGIPCTNFYENYRNDAPYVIDRVRGALPEAGSIGDVPQRPQPYDMPAVEPEPEPIILEIVSANKRPGMAWGTAKCFIRQGVVECGMPYYARINTLEGEEIHVGSLNSGDIAAGSEVKMLLYCDKALLPTIKVLYVFPAEEYDDGIDED